MFYIGVCTKAVMRRLNDVNFVNSYFVGKGIDVGGKPDPLAAYQALFPQMKECRTWDLEDGDAQYMASVPDNSVDFIHSSHCLEHLHDPVESIRNWLRVLRKGGHLIIAIPDEDLYEQGVFPSTYNSDHKWTFTIYKKQTWSPRSINVLELLQQFCDSAEIIKIEQLSFNYRYNAKRFDQLTVPITEYGIEIIIRKREDAELQAHGRWLRPELKKDGRPVLTLRQNILLDLCRAHDEIQALKMTFDHAAQVLASADPVAASQEIAEVVTPQIPRLLNFYTLLGDRYADFLPPELRQQILQELARIGTAVNKVSLMAKSNQYGELKHMLETELAVILNTEIEVWQRLRSDLILSGHPIFDQVGAPPQN